MPSRPDLGPKPHLGYTASLIDRAAHRRGEAAALAADPRAGAYVVGGEMIVARKRDGGGEPLFGLAEAQALAPAREVPRDDLISVLAAAGIATASPTEKLFHSAGSRLRAPVGMNFPVAGSPWRRFS